MTLLIRNVQILGGTRPFPKPTDVFVAGDKISAIGDFPNKKADAVIDGQEAYLSPGFIDVNTDSDHYLTLLEHRGQEDFLRQGVTTIFGGMCGSSLAPLLYGSLESFEKWGETDRINVNWHTTAELLSVLDRHPLGVNFGTLSGHATIRRAILGKSSRDLTKNELRVFSQVLKTAMKEGSFGLSSGLAYVHARTTPYGELKLLADAVKGLRGVYAAHLRDGEQGIKEATEEVIRVARETGVKTLVSHFVPVKGSEAEYRDALAAINALPKEIDLNFDIYPSASSLHALYTFLPHWAQTGGVDVMLANFKDEWLVSKIKKDMPHIDEDHFVIAQAPGNEFLVGKTLRDVKDMYGLADGKDALLRLMATMHMKGGIMYRNLDPELAKEAIKSPRSFIASNAPSFADAPRSRQLKSERTTKTFPDFLRMVQEENLMPLDRAIEKITRIPAQKFGLPLRGVIAEGYYADLTCFKGSEIRFTVVNGRLAAQDGEFKGAFAGRALRHGARA